MTALDDIRERFTAMPPIAVAFWCVDQPGSVWRLRALVEEHLPVPTPLGVFGIPVYEWYSRFADEEDRAKRPACFKVPGVYAEMNDGTWRKV